MPAQSTSQKLGVDQSGKGCGAQVPFDSINEPGCYVSNWTGHLVRVPEDAIKPGRSPLMSITGTETLFVTKISCDPYLTISKARMLAADFDVAVNF